MSDPAVPDRLREEALLEIFACVEVDGPQIVAVYPQENENAWLLGYHALRKDVGLVGAKGLEPARPMPPIVVPGSIAEAMDGRRDNRDSLGPVRRSGLRSWALKAR